MFSISDNYLHFLKMDLCFIEFEFLYSIINVDMTRFHIYGALFFSFISLYIGIGKIHYII